MSTFALDLKQFAEKCAANADKLVASTIAGVAEELDRRSPVGNPSLWKGKAPKGYIGGRFRANWQLGITNAPVGVINTVDPSGQATQERIVATIPVEAAGKVYWLTNNLPYAQRLEDGWSSQRHKGEMVHATVMRFQAIVNEKVEALS